MLACRLPPAIRMPDSNTRSFRNAVTAPPAASAMVGLFMTLLPAGGSYFKFCTVSSSTATPAKRVGLHRKSLFNVSSNGHATGLSDIITTRILIMPNYTGTAMVPFPLHFQQSPCSDASAVLYWMVHVPWQIGHACATVSNPHAPVSRAGRAGWSRKHCCRNQECMVSNGSLGRPVAGMFGTLMANSLNRNDASVCWRFSPVCTFCSM